DPAAALEAIQKARGGAPAAPAPAPAAAPPGQASRAPAIFKALGERIAQNPGLISEVAAVLHFVIKDPDGAFTVDLASAPGKVSEGKVGAAATTLTLAEEDLVALVKGASAQTLHLHGKLRVDGDMRPAHKLAILKDLV